MATPAVNPVTAGKKMANRVINEIFPSVGVNVVDSMGRLASKAMPTPMDINERRIAAKIKY
jgi:hypothetical protein